MNYLNAISEYFPGVEAYTTGSPDVYEDLVFTTGSVTLQEVVDAHLAAVKTDRIIALSQDAEAEIISGFESTALGESYLYDSDLEDQVNLIGAASLGKNTYYACRNVSSGVKSYIMHTNLQMKQVLEDGANVKLAALTKFNGLRDQVYAATTVAEVNAIVW